MDIFNEYLVGLSQELVVKITQIFQSATEAQITDENWFVRVYISSDGSWRVSSTDNQVICCSNRNSASLAAVRLVFENIWENI